MAGGRGCCVSSQTGGEQPLEHARIDTGDHVGDTRLDEPGLRHNDAEPRRTFAQSGEVTWPQRHLAAMHSHRLEQTIAIVQAAIA